jgi:uncharacterized protein YndB with AHSA1/START domain
MSSDGLQLKRIPTVQTAMLIRRPPSEVFAAITDPQIITKVWFTASTGRLEPGARVVWTWEMYDVSVPVQVKEFDQDRHLVLEMGEAPETYTVDWRFEPRDSASTTYLVVTIVEPRTTSETGDDACAWAIDQMGGYTQVLAAVKALLEHGVALSVVRDRWPDGHD